MYSLLSGTSAVDSGNNIRNHKKLQSSSTKLCGDKKKIKSSKRGLLKLYNVYYSVLSIPHLGVQEKHFLCNKINTTNEFKIECVSSLNAERNILFDKSKNDIMSKMYVHCLQMMTL